MKVLEHGNFYQENKIVDCICGCKFEYEEDDIYNDCSIELCTFPSKIRKYVQCPECGARTDIGQTFKYNHKEGGIQ